VSKSPEFHRYNGISLISLRKGLSQGVLLHHYNAPTHTSAVATAAIRDCGFQLLNHPPYSQALAPSDFHVFQSLKDSLRGQTFFRAMKLSFRP